jgi:ribosomal protein S18 acetylase RimI-like enzyme
MMPGSAGCVPTRTQVRGRCVDNEAVDVRLRDIRPSDKTALTRFHARLSPETRYRRYHAVKGDLTRGDLRYLTEVDGHTHVALVALDEDQELRAVARAVGPLDDDPQVAELAVVVADDDQADGVGRELVTAVLRRARDEGYRRIVLEVQADNYRALRFFQGLGARQLKSHGSVLRLGIDVDAEPDAA